MGTAELQPCVYSGFGDNPIARRECLEKGTWSSVMYDECFTMITSMFQDISLVSSNINYVTVFFMEIHIFCDGFTTHNYTI